MTLVVGICYTNCMYYQGFLSEIDKSALHPDILPDDKSNGYKSLDLQIPVTVTSVCTVELDAYPAQRGIKSKIFLLK